jgi:sugar transferase (PEP-CTERM/EpsH1 system associated)
MRILWLSANLLLPLDKGGKLRTWHVMRHLAARHSITYLSFADPETAAEDLEGMKEACARLVTIPRRERTKSGPRFAIDVMRHLVNPVPFAVGQYRSSRYARTVREELASGNYDRVVCDFLVPAVNMPRRLPCPSLLFTHNVEAEIWRRHADTAGSWLRRRLYQQQWRRMQRFENQTLSAFDRVLAVSDLDRQTFHRLYPESRKTPISVIPTGVDTEYFTPTPAAPGATPRIVFTGSMDWLPNVDGVLYFAREILPLIRAETPDVVFTIVGRSPTAEVLELASQPGIEVTGRVEDVRPYLAASTVNVVPLRIGGGTRLKIFEAMAAGRAVVSTTIGAEGLPGEPDRHLMLADDPPAFAQSVVALLQDRDRRLAMESAARTLVTTHYDWAAAAAHFDKALADTATAEPKTSSAVPLISIGPVRPS